MKVILKFCRLFAGLFIYAVGIGLTVKADIGLAPWDVLHQGLSQTLGITFGQASIGAGVIIVALNVLLGEKVGWGTVFNMLFIGFFLDILFENGLLPVFDAFPLRVLQMIAGMFAIGLASFVYLSCELGSGPRDGMMVALTKRTGKPVALVRNSIEIVVLAAGYALGGSVGIGTLLMAFGIGFVIQWVFKWFKFNVKTLRHRFIDADIAWLRQRA